MARDTALISNVPYISGAFAFLSAKSLQKIYFEKQVVPRLLKKFLAPYGNRGHRSRILVSITNQINRVCAFPA